EAEATKYTLKPNKFIWQPIKTELQCSKRCQKLHNDSNISKENGNQTTRKEGRTDIKER
ncbi:hypothetical protein CCACVL1_19691, partial [Corchorus capsularis]